MSEPDAHAHLLVGTWIDAEDGAGPNAVYVVSLEGGQFRVSGTDEHDGEPFTITAVGWDGEWLRFESLMPSNGWRTLHGFRAIDQNRIDHEVTFWETWKRR